MTYAGVSRLPIGSPCRVTDCGRGVVSRGWCRRHYQRWLKWGDPLRERPDLAARLTKWVVTDDGCHEWTAGTDNHGYGVLKVDGEVRRATRLSWQVRYGPIPDGLVVMHLCDNPPCINPDHLVLGTHGANVRDALNKRRRPQNRAA